MLSPPILTSGKLLTINFLAVAIASVILTTAGILRAADDDGRAESKTAGLEFNRDIRPILSDKCYYCHGPDEANQQAGLRLDTAEGAADAIESGEILDRIYADDEDVVMPPPESKLMLTETEKATLKAWLEAGAVYDKHWSFKRLPPTVKVPKISDPKVAKNSIDHFVISRLEKEGLNPSPPATELRWLRRISFDLRGLPPTPEEIKQFQNDLKANPADADSVFSRAVDRMLASPAFGEHMAVSWLDAARYADSYGYQSDKLNTQWPYRDWVIKAFNDNLPLDQFIQWQLAGDLLPEPTVEQRLATAFNRLHRLNNEGGAVFEEWRLENVADRVHTFGTAMLGLTLECCRCHDHKYDPISTREYYSLSAYFNSIDENGLYDRTPKVPSPSLLLPTEKQTAALNRAKEELAAAQQAYDQTMLAATGRFRKGEIAGVDLKKERVRRLLADRLLVIDFDKPYANAMKTIYHPSTDDKTWTPHPELVEVGETKIPRPPRTDGAPLSEKRMAIAFDGERGITTKGIKSFDRWQPFSVALVIRETKRTPLPSVIAHHTHGTDAGYNGWDLMIDNGFIESKLYRVWPGNGIGVRTTQPIPEDQWHQLTATYDGSSDASGLKIFLNGQPLETKVLRNAITKSANIKVDHGGELVLGQRFRDRGFAGGLLADVKVFARDLTQTEIQTLTTGGDLEIDADYYAAVMDQAARAAAKRLMDARQAFVMAEEVMQEIPIMVELDEPRPAHVLARGLYDAETSDDTLVSRTVPRAIGIPFPDDAPQNRLGLAQWVTDPAHPLTGRVFVNRLWANFFGAGLVRTPENFGLQGELPTHPHLLDWLARDFIGHGWDVKRFCKQIVLSATYRQESSASKLLIERDRDNRLLARGPAYRLAAEQIRDLSLAASGLLNAKRGGPPVSPYQPGADLWRESNSMSPAFRQSVGRDLYRRSLYTVWKRTAPMPNMLAFDSSSREVCTVARSRTNTPLQALVLMNDVQFVESSRVLASTVIGEKRELHDRIELAFVRLAGRKPDEFELNLLKELHQEELSYYQTAPQEAVMLIKQGDTAAPDGVDKVELAAMTNVCQAILNLDAAIWKR